MSDSRFTHNGHDVETVEYDAGDGPATRVEVDGAHAGDVWMTDDETWMAETSDAGWGSEHDGHDDAVMALVRHELGEPS